MLEGALRIESAGAVPTVAGPGGILLVAETLTGTLAGWQANAHVRGDRSLG